MNNFEGISFKGNFRDYQQRVLNNVQKYIKDGKVNVVAAPGSGKTILGLELICRLNKPCIILSPTVTIKEQWGERFKNYFLNSADEFNNYFSYDLNKVKLLNSITYQALYSAMEKVTVNDEDEAVDYSNIDLFKLINECGIKTICLDEAHHLQNEWQKALEKFIKGLDNSIKIISLTATPPYDAKPNEWQRYVDVCGEIDEEIFVPELVKQNTLCPHQDYVYFNYPTQEEEREFILYKQNAYTALNKIIELDFIVQLSQKINAEYKYMGEQIYANVKEYIALLTLFKYANLNVNKKLIKSLTTATHLPSLKLTTAEVAIQFLISGSLLLEEQKAVIVKILKEAKVYDKKKVSLDLNDKLKKSLISSVGKLQSIKNIANIEYSSLKDDLRMLVLTDYIKRETLSDINCGKTFSNVSVVSIFETLRQSNPQYKIGVLSGALVILPTNLTASDSLQKCDYSATEICGTDYSIFNFKGGNKNKVQIVSLLFEKGYINILIGTKSLLGEGWDSPCINSLILASFVGSFMLSNQMRGRAIRIDKNNPNKISNIWHLVTFEPDYIFEENVIKKLNLRLNQNTDQIVSYDYEILSRRFECFVGPNYTTGEIESGIDRITTIVPPYSKSGINKMNAQTEKLSQNRLRVKEAWENEVKNGAQIGIQNNVYNEKSKPAFVFINAAGLVLLAILQMLITQTAVSLISSSQNYVVLIAALLVSIPVCYAFIILISKFVRHYSPERSIKTLATCVLKTLKEIGKIESECSLSVKTPWTKSYVSVSLNRASIREQNVFNTCITELLSPIQNPRYVLIAKGLLPVFNYYSALACPSVIGQKKEYVTVFEEYLRLYSTKMRAIYTRNDEGRKLILKCRKKSFITYNHKLLNKKYKISKWE